VNNSKYSLLTVIQSHVEGGYFMSEDVALFDAAFFSLASDVASVSPEARQGTFSFEA
jgi:hypothetical protein